MKLYEFVNSCLIKSNLSANQTLAPMSSQVPEIIEVLDCLNNLLKSFPAQEKLSECRLDCKFRVYRPWVPNIDVIVGDSVIAKYDDEPTRYKCISPGHSETEPDGFGEFTMNQNPEWAPNTQMFANQQYRSDNALWEPIMTGVCGAISPIGRQNFTDDSGFGWRYIREVLYWKNMGPATDYPLDEICPNFANMEIGTMFEFDQGLKLYEISPENWNARMAQRVTVGSTFYMLESGAVKLFPEFNPSAKVGFKYYRKDLVIDADTGLRKSKFEKDNDELSLIPDQLFEWGAVRAWLSQKGLDYADADRYLKETLLPIYRSRQQNTEHIDLTGNSEGCSSIVPEGGWLIGQ